MHFHLPKPLHGWREFAGEVAIIVLGILIALGLEQLVSAAHDRSTAGEARASIRSEIQRNLATIALRQATERCVRTRLREIDAFLDSESRGSMPKPLTWIGAPYAPLLYHTSFQSAQSAGKFFLLPGDEQQQLAAFYIDFDDFNEASTREWYDWAQLRMLARISGSLTADNVARLRAAVQDARAADWLVQIDATHTVDLARGLGVGVPRRNADPYQSASACLPADTPYATAVALAGSSRLPFPE